MKTNFENHKIVILKEEQGNPCYDPAKANNGGGYDQPIITFLIDGKQGVLEDTSCGDFGWRLRLEIEGEGIWSYNSVDDNSSYYFSSEYWRGLNINKVAFILKQLGYKNFAQDLGKYCKISHLRRGEMALYMGNNSKEFKGYSISPKELVGRTQNGTLMVCHDAGGQVIVSEYRHNYWHHYGVSEWEWVELYEKITKRQKKVLWTDNIEAFLSNKERFAKKNKE